MGLEDSICDSCGEPTDILFPLFILDESPTGGCHMVRKFYCRDCFEDAEPAEDLKESQHWAVIWYIQGKAQGHITVRRSTFPDLETAFRAYRELDKTVGLLERILAPVEKFKNEFKK